MPSRLSGLCCHPEMKHLAADNCNEVCLAAARAAETPSAERVWASPCSPSSAGATSRTPSPPFPFPGDCWGQGRVAAAGRDVASPRGYPTNTKPARRGGGAHARPRRYAWCVCRLSCAARPAQDDSWSFVSPAGLLPTQAVHSSFPAHPSLPRWALGQAGGVGTLVLLLVSEGGIVLNVFQHAPCCRAEAQFRSNDRCHFYCLLFTATVRVKVFRLHKGLAEDALMRLVIFLMLQNVSDVVTF